MSYEAVNPIPQFNFQINRVLTYGPLACDHDSVVRSVSGVNSLSAWYQAWLCLAQQAVRAGHFLHAAYAYRMAEFFLKPEDPQKQAVYQACMENFSLGFARELRLACERYSIPFEGKKLNCLRLPRPGAKGTVLVCGGYDSFLEEFVLQVSGLAAQGYEVILFEGPGQGACLGQQLYFRHDFEQAATAVLDYFHLARCALVGISWGGYFALRSAAFEKRICAVAAYDVLDDGWEVMTHIFPVPIRQIVRFAYRCRWAHFLNALTAKLRQKSLLADWALSQGMAITGTHNVYDFYQSLSRHTLAGVTERITQDVLLLAGEKDHYVPLHQFYRLKAALPHAHSLTSRLFTAAEGGEQHCQVGNHQLAVDAITDWLEKYFAQEARSQQ